MLVFKDNILELIPQRPPMVMVDELVSCDETQVISKLTVLPDNLFMDGDGFTASGMMEAMAQTAAARTGFLLKKKTQGTNKKIPVGVIGSIKNFRLFFQPPVGSSLKTTITVEYELMNATLVKAQVEQEGKLAAEAELKIFITEPNPNMP